MENALPELGDKKEAGRPPFRRGSEQSEQQRGRREEVNKARGEEGKRNWKMGKKALTRET